ncbi:hypothetical protein BC793_10850 [Actinoplanes xinjiangensis]|uniref:Uncharacterized protein n=2 Tax=Actinoplanes xinjiangensis TaxID=512350 RepID=A0A316FGV4_9ACTN|nr:hypothetical protein [Actinoplanes xinjiangensis]PWK46936.1 hypothetical protein BC793_10850 [Actinoplanes xinjiangensis]
MTLSSACLANSRTSGPAVRMLMRLVLVSAGVVAGYLLFALLSPAARAEPGTPGALPDAGEAARPLFNATSSAVTSVKTTARETVKTTARGTVETTARETGSDRNPPVKDADRPEQAQKSRSGLGRVAGSEPDGKPRSEPGHEPRSQAGRGAGSGDDGKARDAGRRTSVQREAAHQASRPDERSLTKRSDRVTAKGTVERRVGQATRSAARAAAETARTVTTVAEQPSRSSERAAKAATPVTGKPQQAAKALPGHTPPNSPPAASLPHQADTVVSDAARPVASLRPVTEILDLSPATDLTGMVDPILGPSKTVTGVVDPALETLRPVTDLTGMVDPALETLRPVTDLADGVTPVLVHPVRRTLQPAIDLVGTIRPVLVDPVLQTLRPVTDLVGAVHPVLHALRPVTDLVGAVTPAVVDAVGRTLRPVTDLVGVVVPAVVDPVRRTLRPVTGALTPIEPGPGVALPDPSPAAAGPNPAPASSEHTAAVAPAEPETAGAAPEIRPLSIPALGGMPVHTGAPGPWIHPDPTAGERPASVRSKRSSDPVDAPVPGRPGPDRAPSAPSARSGGADPASPAVTTVAGLIRPTLTALVTTAGARNGSTRLPDVSALPG